MCARWTACRPHGAERAPKICVNGHLGYEKGGRADRGRTKCRNGYFDKTVLSKNGKIDIAVPRDCQGSFEPMIAPKGERWLNSFEERILL